MPENSRRSETDEEALAREAQIQASLEAAAERLTKGAYAEVGSQLFQERSIKLQPELRHVLTHLYYAIEHLIHARPLSAKAELLSVEGLIFFDGGDDDYESWFRQRADELAARSEAEEEPS